MPVSNNNINLGRIGRVMSVCRAGFGEHPRTARVVKLDEIWRVEMHLQTFTSFLAFMSYPIFFTSSYHVVLCLCPAFYVGSSLP